MVELLRKAGCQPVLVFDGASLPMKARTDAIRRAQRLAHRQAAEAMLREGDASGAEKEAAKAIEVTSQMREEFIAALRQRDVAFVVAPYEADAQCAHLVNSGACDAAVTEDGDLLAYHCRSTLFKLQESGCGRLVQFDDLRLAEDRGVRLFDGEWVEEWRSWEEFLFTDMCILAGCDYLEMPGMGIRTAHRMLRRHRSIEAVLGALIRTGELGGKQGRTPMEQSSLLLENYLHTFYKVQLTFKHQRVYDREKRELRLLCSDTDYITQAADFDFLGAPMSVEAARAVCEEATLGPRTLLPVHGGTVAATPQKQQPPREEDGWDVLEPRTSALAESEATGGVTSRFFR